MERYLLTGASGRLGTTLREIEPSIIPIEGDITVPRTLSTNNEFTEMDVIVHCAAFTDVAMAQRLADECFKTNVYGTYNVCLLARLLGCKRVVLISTDHVFDGKRGNYKETDRPNPIGAYATSKFLAEKVVLIDDNDTVLRTSFIKDFPLERAFTDKFFSGDTVEIIARELLTAIKDEEVRGLWHIGTERKSIYDVARKINPNVKKMVLSDNPTNSVGLGYLRDTSFDLGKWERYKRENALR